MKEVLDYFKGDELAAKVWIDKYALHNKKGERLEKTPDDMHKRLAKELARIDATYPHPIPEEDILYLLKDFKYLILAGSPSYGIGNNYSLSSLANCFVIGDKSDSYGGIMLMDQEQVQLMKRRGGVGHDLSHLRPNRAPVTNAAKTSSGVVSFANRYSNSTREVAQEGRRGALMLSLDITHPDILEFISSKDDLTKLTGANISVKITDAFMAAVSQDKEYLLHYKDITIPIKARKVWDKLIYQAWKSAEPGVLFWDKIISESPADCYAEYGFKTVSTNPCGEIPLCPYDSCRLAAMNIYSYVKQPFTQRAIFNWAQLEFHAKRAQKMMDNIVDLEEEKINQILFKIKSDVEDDNVKKVEYDLWDKIRHKLLQGRRTGLGQLGVADAAAALGIKYGTSQFTRFTEKVAKTILLASYEASIIMAKERGAFPIWNYDLEHNNPLIKRVLDSNICMYSDYTKYGRRNISNTTIAPTGTISMMAQVTPGIEPVFKIKYKRRRKVDDNNEHIIFTDDTGEHWEEYTVLHNKYKTWFKKMEIADPYENATADKIDPIMKVKMQGAVQRWVDHSISVTHNLPENTTVEQVSNIYFQAWKSGCKGCTVYREGSRSGILIDKDYIDFKPLDAPKRPTKLDAEIFFPTIKGEQYVVMVGLLNKRPYEVFCFIKNGINLSKTIKTGYIHKIKKSCYNLLDDDNNIIIEDITNYFKAPIEEFATRLISTALRHGAEMKFIVEQLNKTDGLIQDYSKVIARTLKKYIEDEDINNTTCPECKSTELRYEDGCLVCKQCGFSKCG